MTPRIPLDSDIWQTSQSGQDTQAALQAWTNKPPTVAEFRRTIEINGCSDSLYKSFYYALPYFVDELEKNELSVQAQMVSMLDWKLARAFEGESDQQCADIFEAESERLTAILTRMITSGYMSVMQDNLAGIAALNGDVVLAQAILRIEN